MDLLQQALDSVARQTWPSLEVVVIAAKPGHQDLPSLCGPHALRLIKTDTPLHRSRAANRALEEARGDCLLFLDDDDYLLPDHVEKLVLALQEAPHTLVAYSDVQPVDMEGVARGEPFSMPYDPLRLLAGNWMPPQAVLFKRALIQKGCRFDETLDLYEDWDFWLQAASLSSFAHAPGVSACYRIHDSSGVHQHTAFTGAASLKIYHKWRNLWTDTQLSGVMARAWRAPELDDALTHVHQQMALNNAAAAGLQQEMVAKINALTTEINALTTERNARAAEIKMLYESRSWRMTQPLRNLVDGLRVTRKLMQLILRILMHPLWGVQALRRSWVIFCTHGFKGLKTTLNRQQQPLNQDYQRWIAQNEVPDGQYPDLQKQSDSWQGAPMISVLMPTYNSNLVWLKAALDSVREQVYPHWELCIADDASNSAEIHALLSRYTSEDKRIRWIARPANGHISAATNSALAMAEGEFVALLDHDDRLHPLALWFLAQAALVQPDAGLIYTDEDKLNDQGQRCEPYFKCDYNPELMLAQNMISHLGCYRRDVVQRIGGFREGLEGSQDYDLALRVIEQLDPQQIIHIPRVLYHWRIIPGSTAQAIDQKPYAQTAARQAVIQHLQRKGWRAEVLPCPEAPHLQRVRFALPNPLPKVTIIIPTRDKAQLLFTCIRSILDKTTYSNYEIVVVDNGSVEPETRTLFEALRHEGVAILPDKRPFNFSALNNHAAQNAQGELLCLMNNDMEIITPDWLGEMVSFAIRPDIGAVGARLWYPNQTLQHAGVVMGMGGVAGHPHRQLPRGHVGYFGRAVLHQSFSAVTAACLLIRKSIYTEVGGLDESLAVAFNDVDFCLRVRAAGYRNVWTPYAEMIHHESVSRGLENTPEKLLRFEAESAIMHERWGALMANDPAYSPNLSLHTTGFDLAFPSRAPTAI